MKKGFISMSLVYTFLIVFVFVNVSIITIYTRKMNYLDTIDEKINEEVKLNYGLCLDNNNSLFCQILRDNDKGKDDKDINFSINSSEKGLYYTSDTSKTNKKVYYYRGNVDNNYVIFANMCFRIIRTNADNSTKLIYYGLPDNEGICSRNNMELVFSSSNYSNISYANSNVKNVIENWYKNNLKDYDKYIEDTIYCNDKYNNVHKLICNSPSSSYSVSEYTGNGSLKYPVALITIDELIYSGAILSDTSNSYLNGNTTLTLSNDGSKIYSLLQNSIGLSNLNDSINILPVISLKSSVKVDKGNGKFFNPYVVNK